MIPLWQAATLGAVQGLTEFLPISSSAHLVLVPWAFGWNTGGANIMAFDVALHFGTLIAVGVYFFFDWLLIAASYIGDLRQKRWLGGPRGSLLPKIVMATVPGAVIGKLFEEKVDAFFYTGTQNLWIVAVAMAVFGLFLLIGERMGKQDRDTDGITYLHALLIGCAQALAAVMPGVSRSGITILAGLLIGLKRPAAARFSFLLATPIIAGSALLKMRELHADMALAVGVLTAAVVGMLAIKFLLKYVQTRSYAIFVYYRWIVAAAVLALFYVRMRGGQ
jgi:undecaprenyl-diphosphatase